MVESEGKNDEKDDDEISVVENLNLTAGRGRRTAIIGDRLRADGSNEEKRKANQERLAKELNTKALARLSRGKEEVAGPRLKKASMAYRNVNNFPTDEEVKHLQIHVDRKSESLVRFLNICSHLIFSLAFFHVPS